MSSDPADDFAPVVPEVDAPAGFLTRPGKRTYDVLVGTLLAVCGVAVFVLPTVLQFKQQQEIATNQQFLQQSCGAQWQGQLWTVSPDWTNSSARLERRDLTDNAPATEVARLDFVPQALIPNGETLWLMGSNQVARISPDHLEPIKLPTNTIGGEPQFFRAGDRLFASVGQYAQQGLASSPTPMDVATGNVTTSPVASDSLQTFWVNVIHEWVNGEWTTLGELNPALPGAAGVDERFPIDCKVFAVDGELVTWMSAEGTAYWAEGLPVRPLGTGVAQAMQAAMAPAGPVSALEPANIVAPTNEPAANEPVANDSPAANEPIVWHRTQGGQVLLIDQILRLGDRWMLLDSTVPFGLPADIETTEFGRLPGPSQGELRLLELQNGTWELKHTLPASSLYPDEHDFFPTDQPDEWLVSAGTGWKGRSLVRVRADGLTPAFTMDNGFSRVVWQTLDSMLFGTTIGVTAQFLMVFGTAWLMSLYRYPYVAVSREEVRLASLVSRSVARVIDGIVFSIPIYVATGLYLWLNYEELLATIGAGLDITPDRILQLVYRFLVLLAVWFGYWLLAFLVYAMMLAWTGASPGKWLVGIRVCQTSLAQPGLGRAFVRELVYIVDSFGSLLVGIATIAYTQKYQRVGDLLAGTMVVSARSLGAARARLQERSR